MLTNKTWLISEFDIAHQLADEEMPPHTADDLASRLYALSRLRTSSARHTPFLNVDVYAIAHQHVGKPFARDIAREVEGALAAAVCEALLKSGAIYVPPGLATKGDE